MKGIDLQIEKQRIVFVNYLWTGNTVLFNGRCMRNYRKDAMIPECLSAGKEYKDVLLDDTKDAICFFDVLPERTENEASIDIYFAVKLSKLYSSVTERATEYVLSDTLLLIKQTNLFKAESFTDGYESWSQWGNVKKEDNMQPFYLFKISTKVNYSLTC